jgi:glucose/arabinose dehydrogenase
MKILSNRRAMILIMLLLIGIVVALNFNRALGLVTRPFGVSVDLEGGRVAATSVPQGFEVSVFASGLQGPRFMAVGHDGTVYVAEQSGGRVTALRDTDGDGKAEEKVAIVDGLVGPSSVVVYSNTLIIGEHTRVSQVALDSDGRANERKVLVPDLPNEGFHHTKTVLIGPDGRLYVSIGSSCNVCNEGDERRAAVTAYDLDGRNGKLFARGLRNAVGLALNPWTNEIWATNNGRDLMGDNQPPETLYSLSEGEDYGWPRCHAGTIVDPAFGGKEGCDGVVQPILNMQAHMAPLGLAFYGEGPFPPPYNNSLYVAFHGSWNSSVKVGYKVMQVPLKDGRVAGEPQDFMTGFLAGGDSVLGRPAGVTVAPDSSLLVSDDKGGFVYRVAWKGR